MVRPDFDIRRYFTPKNFTPGFPNPAVAGWYRPYQLAYLNLSNVSVDTIPQQYQYVNGNRWENGLRAPVHYNEDDGSAIIINKSFTGGSYAQVIFQTKSDRDIFEIVDNEGILELPVRYGHMMPHVKYPLGSIWDINLSLDGTTWADPILFRGQLTRVRPQILSDRKISGQQDGEFRWTLEFTGWENGLLSTNRGVSLYHHRVAGTTDNYHEAFDANSAITFNQAISRVVTWMNLTVPTNDFPTPTPFFTWDESAHNYSPYTIMLNAVTFPAPPVPTFSPNLDEGTWNMLVSLLHYMGAYEGLGKKYLPQCSIDGVISVVLGGFDKAQAATELFRDTQSVTYVSQGNGVFNIDVTTTIDFTMIKVPFTAQVNKEYWIKVTLYKWNGSGWDTVFSSPANGYEFVPYDPKNTHNAKYYTFVKQDKGRYKWEIDHQIASGGVTVDTSASAGYFASAPEYNLLPSHLEMDLTKLQTFVRTRGACQDLGDPTKCPDYVAGYCPDQFGCYPDPLAGAQAVLTGTLSFTGGSTTVSGSGTVFLSEVAAGDKIKVNTGTQWQVVSSVGSDTSITLTEGFYDPCFLNLSGAGSKKSPSVDDESLLSQYGFRVTDTPSRYYNISNQGSWNTLCRLSSKRKYECALNMDSSVREPMDAGITFMYGNLTDLRGVYVEYYDTNKDENVTFRTIEQEFVLLKKSIRTTIRGFRV